MTEWINRRTFIEIGAFSALGTAAHSLVSESESARTVRVGVIGTGGRGTGLLKTMLLMKDVSFPALCDINLENLARALDCVVKAGQPKPEGYSSGDYAFEKLLERDDIDAVIIATPWQWHTPMAVSAMKHGKYTGVEVPAAITLEQCWELIDTHESTGTPCMMLENWSFRRDNLAVLNIIRQGLFGEIVHCHCAHSHDCIDHWFFDTNGKDRWAAEFLITRNCDQYPTHSLGPVLSWMDINCGDYFATISSTASASKGINAYFKRKFGQNHPNATKVFKQGDIVTSVVKTHKGKTIVINYDMQLPQPYDNRWMIQGTLGIYNEQRNALYITEVSPSYHQWEPFPPYQDRFDHVWWRTMMGNPDTLGHGGTDYLELDQFLKAAREKAPTPIDIYDSVLMSSVVPLSEESITKGSLPVEYPDFTRGKWKTNKPTFAV